MFLTNTKNMDSNKFYICNEDIKNHLQSKNVFYVYTDEDENGELTYYYIKNKKTQDLIDEYLEEIEVVIGE